MKVFSPGDKVVIDPAVYREYGRVPILEDGFRGVPYRVVLECYIDEEDGESMMVEFEDDTGWYAERFKKYVATFELPDDLFTIE